MGRESARYYLQKPPMTSNEPLLEIRPEDAYFFSCSPTTFGAIIKQCWKKVLNSSENPLLKHTVPWPFLKIYMGICGILSSPVNRIRV